MMYIYCLPRWWVSVGKDVHVLHLHRLVPLQPELPLSRPFRRRPRRLPHSRLRQRPFRRPPPLSFPGLLPLSTVRPVLQGRLTPFTLHDHELIFAFKSPKAPCLFRRRWSPACRNARLPCRSADARPHFFVAAPPRPPAARCFLSPPHPQTLSAVPSTSTLTPEIRILTLPTVSAPSSQRPQPHPRRVASTFPPTPPPIPPSLPPATPRDSHSPFLWKIFP